MNLVELLQKKNLTLSVAESCTGGLISSLITDIPDSSKVFVFGAVTYSLSMKEKLLSVSHTHLVKNGPYNYETVIEMAKNIKKYSKTDVSIAVSGVAGPSDEIDTKAGVCYVAVDFCGKIYTKIIDTKTNKRKTNKEKFARKSIEFLIEIIENHCD
ncbi:MAG: CinA family protein [Clostridia bacterium]|nr:CinA family protein [Clostridia bacterium]